MSLPITALYAGLAGLLLLFLSWRVTEHRKRARVSLGGGGDAGLEAAIRAQGNLTEYAPMVLLLMAAAELNAAPGWLVHVIGAALILGRLMHAWGLGTSAGVSVGRFWGTALTWIALLAGALVSLWSTLF